MNQFFEDLKTKSKNDLIILATGIMRDKYEIVLNAEEFDARVWEGNHGGIEVIFRRYNRYCNNEAEDMRYGLIVDLVNQELYLDSNLLYPFNNDEMQFYIPSKRAIEVIEELKEKGLLPKVNTPDIEYTITENEHYYLISCFDNLPSIDRKLMRNEESPYLSKSLVHKKTGEMLFFKGNNPFFFLSQITFDHYYEKNLFVILKEQDRSSFDKIVKISDSILHEKFPDLLLDPCDFENMVLANYKDLVVKYRRYVRFSKGNAPIAFDISVNIITGELVPLDSPNTIFSVPSSTEKKRVSNIQKIIPLEQGPSIEHNVSENKDYYFVTSTYERATKKYFIDKNKNILVWTNDAYTLQMDNREDLTLQEHYKRMNTLFELRALDTEPLLKMVSEILLENKLDTIIKLDEFRFTAKASKTDMEVGLTRLVKYTALKNESQSTFDLAINLVNRSLSYDPERFYVSSKEEAAVIEQIEAQLADYFEESQKPYYPIEIIEKVDCYDIKVSGVDGSRSYEDQQYRLDKRTKAIEVVDPLINPIYPTPAMPRPPRREIED